MDIKKLSEEFPRDAIHWRAQTLTRNSDKALALAYLDARDVMDRLDDVCGPENWQDEYIETAKGRIVCRLGIRINDEWVWKSDGAGETAVEGEKGGISDALKRAAVKWGIGRYLYRMDAVWAPCESYEKNGKKHWSKWKGSPWDFVRTGAPAKSTETPPQPNYRQIANNMITAMKNAATYAKWNAITTDAKFKADLAKLEADAPPMAAEVRKAIGDAKMRIDPAGQAA